MSLHSCDAIFQTTDVTMFLFVDDIQRKQISTEVETVRVDSGISSWNYRKEERAMRVDMAYVSERKKKNVSAFGKT
ncbi:hypothetical protein DPMN_095791 [Dreissena polymorpha]|uniref:Uncharacterized protein n=1 Tax=Dreissena polymorpha TaxID=45954 RepID=A0A9D4L8K8_DREPO|nr:hypothetical protein DPMN_095791 [Dreissena polymorpha]